MLKVLSRDRTSAARVMAREPDDTWRVLAGISLIALASVGVRSSPRWLRLVRIAVLARRHSLAWMSGIRRALRRHITVITGDGYRGHPDEAPFDRVIVTAAPEKVPQPLLDQLRVGRSSLCSSKRYKKHTLG